MSERVWITDGSVPVFSDTRRLRASHRGLLGLPVRYEGVIDPAVPRGSARVEGDRRDDALFAEAEWYVRFPDRIDRYLDDPLLVDDSTSLVLQGMIEGKWLNRLLGTREWRPASLGNNVIADGPGIRTTLAEIEWGTAGGTTRVEYALAAGRIQAHVSTLADLRGQNVLELLRDVLRACREDGHALDGIDLGAVGHSAATVNEPARLKAALRGNGLLPNPLNILPHRAKERLVRGALADDVAVPPGAQVSLTTSDDEGTVVGEATLTWRRTGSA